MIRIRMDPQSFHLLDPYPHLKCKEIAHNCKFIQFFKVNLHKAPLLLTFEQLFMFNNYRKICMSLFFTNFVGSGSGSAFFKQLNPDQYSEKLLDPDPQKMNADPQS